MLRNCDGLAEKILWKFFIKAVMGAIFDKGHTNMENRKVEGPIVGETSRRQVQNSGVRNGRDKIVEVAVCGGRGN